MPLPYPFNKQPNPLVLPAGYLRTEIALQSQDLTPDEVTGKPPAGGWATYLPALAAIELIANVQIGQNMTLASQVTHVIVTRWPGKIGDTIAEGHRVLLVANGETYEVQSAVNLMKRNRVLHIYCIRITGKG